MHWVDSNPPNLWLPEAESTLHYTTVLSYYQIIEFVSNNAMFDWKNLQFSS